LFGAYAAIDPSLWWDKGELSKTAAARMRNLAKARPFYMAQAKEQLETPAAGDRVTLALKGSGVQWCVTRRPDLLHSTIYQQLVPQALQFVLPPKQPPMPEFGFVVQCSEKP
jgi:predicted alpha/beta superfamily hydrolase